jgi:hypothetical protein
MNMKFFQKPNLLIIAGSLMVTALHPVLAQSVNPNTDAPSAIVALKVHNVSPSIMAKWLEPYNKFGIPGVESIVPSNQTGEIWVKGTLEGIAKLGSILTSSDNTIVGIEVETQFIEMSAEDAQALLWKPLSKPGVVRPNFRKMLGTFIADKRATVLNSQRLMTKDGSPNEISLDMIVGEKIISSVTPTTNDRGMITLAVQFPQQASKGTPVVLNADDGDTVAVQLPRLESGEVQQVFALITSRLICRDKKVALGGQRH